MKESADQIEDRGLARAVWADDKEDLARIHRQRNALHRAQTAKAFSDILHFQNGRHWAPPSAGCGLASFGGLSLLRNRCCNPPTMPSGRKRTTRTMRTP